MATNDPNQRYKVLTDGNLRVTSLTKDWTDTVLINGIKVSDTIKDNTIIGRNFMVEQYENSSAIFSFGDYHPTYDNCACNGVVVRGAGPDSVEADISWIMIRGISRDAGFKRARNVAICPYQTQEIRNYDINGRKTKVLYTLPNPDPRFPPYKIADVRTPSLLTSIKIVQYEDITGPVGNTPHGPNKIGDLVPNVNISELFGTVSIGPWFNTTLWNGFPANTLLFLGKTHEYSGCPIARCDYAFMHKYNGWNKFISVYTQKDGYVPKDIKDFGTDLSDPATPPDANPSSPRINGIGVFDMLSSKDFATLLPEIDDSVIDPTQG